MTTFDDRERAFERKFMLDEELKFKIEARRDKALGEWVARQLGFSGVHAKAYVVFQKVRTDLRDAGVPISDGELSAIHEAVGPGNAARHGAHGTSR